MATWDALADDADAAFRYGGHWVMFPGTALQKPENMDIHVYTQVYISDVTGSYRSTFSDENQR